MTVLHRNAYSRKQCSSVVTIGNFDGLHIGHTAILQKLVGKRDEMGAESLRTVLVSFYPHPVKVLRGVEVPTLTPLRVKMDILHKLRIDELRLLRFTSEMSKLSAADFVKRFLIDLLDTQYLLVGADAAVGSRREGSVDVLAELMKSHGREFEVFPNVDLLGTRVSSGGVRNLLLEGKVEEVALHLGRNYQLSSRVVPGDGRGKQLGVPTANLAPSDQLLPARGVYACILSVGTKQFPSVTNVGRRPTFGGESIRAEVHVLDQANLDLYGKRVELHFVAKLREEKKFPGPGELKSQIALDIIAAREALRV